VSFGFTINAIKKPKMIILIEKEITYLYNTKLGSLNFPNAQSANIEMIPNTIAYAKKVDHLKFLRRFFM
jgi:hypothetical protein